MLIFLLSVFLMIALSVSAFIIGTTPAKDWASVHTQRLNRLADKISETFINVACVLLVLVIAMIGTFAVNAIMHMGRLADNQADYQRIMARIESGYCGYEKCVIDEVIDFNTALAKNNIGLSSPWSSWFFCDDYKGLQPIDVNLAVHCDHGGHMYRPASSDQNER